MVLGSPRRQSADTLKPGAEVVAPATTVATDVEILEAVHLDCVQRGVRFQRNLFEHVQATYAVLRKRAMIGGDGTVSIRQLARDLYPDVGDDFDAYRRKRQSVQRWLRLLKRQELITTHVLRNGSGKSLGLQTALLPIPQEITRLARVRGCSSAGLSDTVRIQRRRMSPQEACNARVRPHCPRADQSAPSRFESDARVFGPAKFVAPGGQGGVPLRGLPPCPENGRAVRARGAPGGGSVDASERSAEQEAAAALERRLTAALGGEAFATLRRAEEALVTVLGEPFAGRLRHLPTIRELLWAFERLDRYGARGRGSPGAGISVLESKLEAHAWSVRWEGAALPAHLGYFLPALRAEAKRWKHTWAPRIKAGRRAAGTRRRPRRSPIAYRRTSS